MHVKINGECFTESEREQFINMFENHADTINIDHVVNVWPGLQIADEDSKMYDTGADMDFTGKPICSEMFYNLVIHSNGDVSPCCVDYTFQKNNLGNVMTSTLKEIWESDRRRNLLLSNLQSDALYTYEICNQCSAPSCSQTVNLEAYRDALMEKLEK